LILHFWLERGVILKQPRQRRSKAALRLAYDTAKLPVLEVRNVG
jgi:hypothetical protein